MSTSIGSLPSILLLLLFLASLFVLTKAADCFIDNAVLVSRNFGIPEFIIGASIVSLGTTLPELASSVVSASKGISSFALGNSFGSIITNSSLVLGLSAIAGKISAPKLAKNRFLFFCFSVLLFFALSLLPLLQGSAAALPRWGGFLLLVLLLLYFGKSLKTNPQGLTNQKNTLPKGQGLSIALKIFFSAILIAISASTLVETVVVAASRLGVPQWIISATVVALGTSLPELSTSILSAKKGHGSLAIGNVLGANLLNILLVLGTSTAMLPNGLPVPKTFFLIQVPLLCIILLLFARLFYSKNHNEITKADAIFLLLLYLAYLLISAFFGNA